MLLNRVEIGRVGKGVRNGFGSRVTGVAVLIGADHLKVGQKHLDQWQLKLSTLNSGC